MQKIDDISQRDPVDLLPIPPPRIKDKAVPKQSVPIFQPPENHRNDQNCYAGNGHENPAMILQHTERRAFIGKIGQMKYILNNG